MQFLFIDPEIPFIEAVKSTCEDHIKRINHLAHRRQRLLKVAMAADHLHFLKDKFITDFTEAVGKFEQIPLWSSFQEIRAVLQEMTISSSTPIVMKNCLYDLRYLLAECILFAEKEVERATKKKKSHFSAYSLKKFLFLRKIEKKLQQIKQKLQCFSNGAAAGSTMLSDRIQFDQPVCAPAGVPPLDASRVHGLDEQLQQMVALLLKTSDDDGFKAIGITGMIGVGKSTLAKLVCHSSQVQKMFSPIIWLRLSEKAGPQEIIKHLLLKLGATCELVYCSALSEQLRELSDQLSGKKYLIVLDNVWVLNDWYSDLGSNQDTNGTACLSHLSSGLPRRGGGTIIVTSRCHGVARSMVVGEQSILKLQPLFNAESIWSIFMDSVHQKTFITSDHLPTLFRMKDEIVDRCDGLPLAAKILAEVISTQMGKQEYWSNSKIEKRFCLRLDTLDKQCYFDIMRKIQSLPGVECSYPGERECYDAVVVGRCDPLEIMKELGRVCMTELISVSRRNLLKQLPW